MATIPEAWIPAVIFGNLFAFFWLGMLFKTYTPMASKKKKEEEKQRDGKAKGGGGGQVKRFERSRTDVEIEQVITRFHVGGTDNPPMVPPAAAGASTAVGVQPHHRQVDSLGEDPEGPATIAKRMTRNETIMVPRMELEWKNIGCTYRSRSSVKTVLQGVYGVARPCEMLALMGPSGAGKSTLLDILTMRKSVGELSGEVLMNGHDRRPDFVRMSSYVPQEDNFIPTMTTLETLTFYSRMVLPRDMSNKEKRMRVKEVLYMVGLSGSKNTMVGGTLPGGIHLRGLSGGERRRLSIAAGVVSAPSIIFLDEPTSGLDSFAALNVMQYMKTLAQVKGHIVIASIHQPRMSIWNMFDKAVILSKGRMMYSGPTSSVVGWFSNILGYSYDPDMHGVVSDWVIDLVSIGFNKPVQFYGTSMRNEQQLLEAAEKFYTAYKCARRRDEDFDHEQIEEDNEESDEEEEEQPTVVRKTTTHYVVELPHDSEHETALEMTNVQTLGRQVDRADSPKPLPPPKKPRRIPVLRGRYPSSWISQFLTLFWRAFLNITRNPADVAGRMLTFTYVGLFIGLIFYDLSSQAESVWIKLNIMYNNVAFFMFIPYVSMSLFTSDRQFYSADVSAKMYHPSAYYCANVASALPFSILNACVFAFTVYGMAGLNNDAEAMFKHIFLLVLESLIALQVLYLAAVVTHTQDTAFMIAIAFTTLNILLSNYFIPFDQIQFPWVSWLSYFSAMSYTFNAAIQLEFGGRFLDCSQGLGNFVPDFGQAFLDAFPGSNNLTAQAIAQQVTNPGEDCVFEGDTVLKFFNEMRPYGATVAILVGYLAILHILTFGGLLSLAKKDKR